MGHWVNCRFIGKILLFALSCKLHPVESFDKNVQEQNSSPIDSSSPVTFKSHIKPAFLYHGLLLDSEKRVFETVSSEELEKLIHVTNRNETKLAGTHIPSQSSETFALSNEEEDGSAYVNSCRKAKVPIPPPLKSSKWKVVGTMDQERLFSPGPRTELWRYDTADGICAALPRYMKDAKTIQLFGVICVNKKSGNTCFWDNSMGIGKSKQITDDTDNSLFGADRATENCTACHRGPNPWIVFPDQPTTKLPKTSYIPQGPASWQNSLSDLPCGGCHAMPTLTYEYCHIMQTMVKRGLMPPDRILKTDSALQTEYDTLLKACPGPPDTNSKY